VHYLLSNTICGEINKINKGKYSLPGGGPGGILIPILIPGGGGGNDGLCAGGGPGGGIRTPGGGGIIGRIIGLYINGGGAVIVQ
jgi:hypothetical protein